MKPVEENSTEKCCRKVTNQIFKNSYICEKKATHTNGTHFFCRKHSKMGRFVIRLGDVGEIVARFDTENEIKSTYPMYDSDIFEMQKISPSHRKRIFPDTKSTKLFDDYAIEIYVGNILKCDYTTYLIIEENGEFIAVHEPSCGSEREGMQECKRDNLEMLLKLDRTFEVEIKS